MFALEKLAKHLIHYQRSMFDDQAHSGANAIGPDPFAETGRRYHGH
jgi:hypothetical protein